MKRIVRKHIACITAVALLAVGSTNTLPVLSPTDSMAATDSILDFANRLTAQSVQNPSCFASLRFATDEQVFYRDDTAVGTEYDAFSVINGKVMVKKAATLTSAERQNEGASDGYIPFDDAAEKIGCEITEQNGDYIVVSPFQSAALIVRSDGAVPAYGAVSETDGYQNLHVMQYSTAADAYAAYRCYLTDQTVDFVEPNRTLYLASAAEPQFIRVNDRWGLDAIGADEYRSWLYSVKTNLPEIVVAVIDTGIYQEHSWFENRIAEGGTGFTYDEKGSYEDGHGHGTHCAGIICSSTLDNVKILPIKCLSDEGYGSTMEVYCAMMYAAEQQPDVISMSLGGIGISPLLSDACAVFAENDIPCAVAAGNESIDTMYAHPASVDSVFTVSAVGNDSYDGSSDSYGEDAYSLAYFSNFGSKVDFCAPGVDIESAGIDDPNSTTYKSGTSMATPYVAGCIADLLSYDDTFTSDEIYQLLKQFAYDLGTAGYDESYGWGMVRLFALSEDGKFCAAPTASLVSGSYDGVQSVTLSCPTENADIYYTLDGTVPTAESGILYDGNSISIEASCELRAIAVFDGTSSTFISRKYEILCKPPVITPVSGQYEDPLTVSISCVSNNAKIYYTLDGSTPSAKNGTLYSDPFTVSESAVLRAVAVSGKAESEITRADYCINGEDISDPYVIIDGVLVAYNGVASVLDLSDLYITAVGDNAFTGNRLLTKIILPDSVAKLGANAFQGCEALEFVTAAGVTELGTGVFSGCTELYQILTGAVQEIPDYAFYLCGNLSQTEDCFIHVTSVGDYAFYECDWLGSSGLDWTQIQSIGDYAFSYAWFYDDVSFDSLEHLGIHVFDNAYGFSNISLPNSLTVLPEGTFRNCNNLTSLSAPGIIEIGDYAMAFSSYEPLDTGTLFSQITKIGSYAFSDFNFNGSVEFTNVTDIAENAFSYAEADSMSFPALQHTGHNAFANAYFDVLYLEHIETIAENTFSSSSPYIVVVGDELTEMDVNAASNYWQMTLAGPAVSPARTFANSHLLTYYETPGVYLDTEGESLTLQQYDPQTIAAYPLGFGLSLEWYSAADENGADPVYLQSANALEINVMESGTYYYYAAVYKDGAEVARSNVLRLEVIPTEIIGTLSEKDRMTLIDWDQYESGAIAYQFSPETADYYYFEAHGFSADITVLDQYGSVQRYYATAYVEPGDVYTVLIRKSGSERWNALYISDKYISSYFDGEMTLDADVYQYTGSAIEPSVSVIYNHEYYDNDTLEYVEEQITLTEGTDYIVRYDNNIDPGTAYAFVFCMGDYTSFSYSTFKIYRPILEDTPESVYDFTYGKIPYFCFEPEVTDEYLIYTEYADDLTERFESESNSSYYTDTILTIYDSDWNEIGYNDDGGQLLFSAIWLDLEAGQRYYVVLDAWSSSESASVCFSRKTHLGIEGYLEASKYNYVYTGEAIEPEYKFYVDDVLLTEGTDYTARIFHNVNPGSMTLIVIGQGSYCGMYVFTEFSISIDFDELDDTVIEIEPDVPFTLSELRQIYSLIIPSIGLYCLRPTDADDEADYCGECYTYYYDGMYESWYCTTKFTPEYPESELYSGMYYLILTQDATEEREFILETVEAYRSLYYADVTVTDAVYTGELIVPKVTVIYEGTELTENVDYIVSCNQPMITCGYYTLIIQGIGEYYGNAYAYFQIVPDLSAEIQILTEETNTVTANTGGETAFYSWIPDESQYCLWKDQLEYTTISVYDSDMQIIEYNDGIGLIYTEVYVEPGNQYYISAAFADRTMTGSFDFTLTSDYALLDYCEVDTENLLAYQENAQVPDYTVRNGDTVLTEGVDYEVFYLGGNDDYGRAEICFKGKGHYIGYLDFSFYIYPDHWNDVIPDQQIDLAAEETVFTERGLPGAVTLYTFTADHDATYYLNLPNTDSAAVTAFVYGTDGFICPLSQHTFELKAGDTIQILCMTDWLETSYDIYDMYSVQVTESAPSEYYWTENGLCYYLENGLAYLLFVDDMMLETGFYIPDVIYDPEGGIQGAFAGIGEELYRHLAFTNTIYCEQGGLVADYCSENGYCYAFTDPQTTLAGDVTGDGLVNQNDAWTLLRWMTEASGMQMTEQGYANADINGDGIADMLDVNQILRYTAP